MTDWNVSANSLLVILLYVFQHTIKGIEYYSVAIVFVSQFCGSEKAGRGREVAGGGVTLKTCIGRGDASGWSNHSL